MTGAGASRAMTAPAFVAQCQRQGIRLAVVGDKIKASGKPPPRPEAFAAFLKAHKPEILEILAPPNFATARNPDAAEKPTPCPVAAPNLPFESVQPRTTACSEKTEFAEVRGKKEKLEERCKTLHGARVWTLDDDLTAHPCYVKRPRWATGYKADGEKAGEWLMSLTDSQRSLLFLLETWDVPRPPGWSEADEATYRALWSADLTRCARTFALT